MSTKCEIKRKLCMPSRVMQKWESWSLEIGSYDSFRVKKGSSKRKNEELAITAEVLKSVEHSNRWKPLVVVAKCKIMPLKGGDISNHATTLVINQ